MPRRKALKVVVDVELHAVTCPGVFLPDREDVFINIDIFGQLKRSQYHPPVFPFLFHEKIRFEKVFSTATDPIQVAQELCNETVQIELVQLSYPGGELLGSYMDNARDFLFPTPKVSPTYPGVDREILFERSASFPGIAPKLEFSSRTTIKEVTSSGRALGEKKPKDYGKTNTSEPMVNGRPSQIISHKETSSKPNYGKNSSKAKTSGKRKKTKSTSTNDGGRRGRTMHRSKSAGGGTTMWGYEQPTIASRARSPSPYTRRRMAELSIKDPFETATKSKPFKTVIDNKPEFVVRKVAEDALSLERTPPPPKSPTFEKRSPRYRASSSHRSYTSPRQNGVSPRETHNYPISNSSDDASDIHTSLRCGRGTPSGSRLSSGRSGSPGHREPSFSVGDLDNAVTSPRYRRDATDSILHRIPLENRLSTQPSPYEKIRDRVRALLSSPRATQIANDAVYEGEERYRRRMSRSPSPRSPRY